MRHLLYVAISKVLAVDGWIGDFRIGISERATVAPTSRVPIRVGCSKVMLSYQKRRLGHRKHNCLNECVWQRWRLVQVKCFYCMIMQITIAICWRNLKKVEHQVFIFVKSYFIVYKTRKNNNVHRLRTLICWRWHIKYIDVFLSIDIYICYATPRIQCLLICFSFYWSHTIDRAQLH